MYAELRAKLLVYMRAAAHRNANQWRSWAGEQGQPIAEGVVDRKGKRKGDKSEAKWTQYTSSGCTKTAWEAIVSTDMGVRRAATITRVGLRRIWDWERMTSGRGLPKNWNPDEEVMSGDPRVRFLAKEDLFCETFGHEARSHPLTWGNEDSLDRGFSEQCAGGQVR